MTAASGRIRTWTIDAPSPVDPTARHRATFSMDDQPVASAEGDDEVSAFFNLAAVLRRRGMAEGGVMVPMDRWERFFTPEELAAFGRRRSKP